MNSADVRILGTQVLINRPSNGTRLRGRVAVIPSSVSRPSDVVNVSVVHGAVVVVRAALDLCGDVEPGCGEV
jgi:predicted aconitase with swiveling domain